MESADASGQRPATGMIYRPRSWFEPLRWTEVFARSQPVEVDLGCGKGAFLLWAARARADVNFLGVDRLLGRLNRLAAKAERAGLPNVRLLRIEASYFVQYLVPAGTVAGYHINFPDPWPKRRHQPRRLFSEQLIVQLHRTLVRDGVVNIATDDAGYAQAIRRLLGGSGLFREEPPELPPREGWTDFERGFATDGVTIHRSRWRSRTSRSSERTTLPRR